MSNVAIADTSTLVSMLQTCRPGGSKSERRFIADYLIGLDLEIDQAGNLSKRIGDAPVLWSSHTDTVHKQGGQQHIVIVNRHLRLAASSKSNCLGADCTAGVWLMREMIIAQRPGLYVFHRGEESGGVGSRHIAERTPAFLEGIQYAIALDRRGTTDVITHQGFGRCCSDAFAVALSGRLGNGFKPNDTGIFTDTANYMSLVPECTNLSVGYSGEHSKAESLNLDHLLAMRKALLQLDVTGLPVARDPDAMDCYDDWGLTKHAPYGLSMRDMIIRNPELIADILEEFGVDGTELADELYQRGGTIPL